MNHVSGIVGFIAGVVSFGVVSKLKPKAGTLKIDHSDPNKDRYLFDIKDLDKLSKRKRIILKVDNKADLSDMQSEASHD